MLLIFILFGLVCLLGVCFIIAMLYTFDMLEEINDLRKQKELYRELYDNASKYINKKLKNEKNIHNFSNSSDVSDELMCD